MTEPVAELLPLHNSLSDAIVGIGNVIEYKSSYAMVLANNYGMKGESRTISEVNRLLSACVTLLSIVHDECERLRFPEDTP
jgi:hypothetical protein